MIAPINSRWAIGLEYINGRHYVSYDGSATLVLDVESERWYQDSRGFTAIYNDAGNLFRGTNGAADLELESGATDAGNPISIIYRSRYEDCGLNDPHRHHLPQQRRKLNRTRHPQQRLRPPEIQISI